MNEHSLDEMKQRGYLASSPTKMHQAIFVEHAGALSIAQTLRLAQLIRDGADCGVPPTRARDVAQAMLEAESDPETMAILARAAVRAMLESGADQQKTRQKASAQARRENNIKAVQFAYKNMPANRHGQGEIAYLAKKTRISRQTVAQILPAIRLETKT